MELDRFLNSKSISVLQSYYFFWTGSSEIPRSKAQLLRRLRGAMLDRKKVAARFEALGDIQKNLIRNLLRSDGFRRNTTDRAEDLAQTFEELEAVGFLDVERSDDERKRITAVGLPADFAVLLAEAVGMDLRPAARLLSLRSFLQGLPDDRRDQLLSRWVGASVTIDSAIGHLLEPGSILQRLESLGDTTKEEVREAMLRLGGVVEWKGKNQSEMREELEDALMGTIATLELASGEFTLKGRHLIVFQEIVEAFCRSLPPSEPGEIQVRGVDLLCDISLLGRACLTGSLRVKRTGEPYAGSRRKLQERMLVCGQTEEEDLRLLSWKLSLAARLDLVEPNADKTRCRLGNLRDWERLSLTEKLQRLADAVGDEPGPTEEAPAAETAREAIAAIAESGESWASPEATVARIAARRLLDVAARQSDISLSAPSGVPPFDEFRNRLSHFVRHTLWIAGLTEVSDTPDGLLVRWARWQTTPLNEEEKLLLLGPDFELLVIGEHPPPALIYAVERLAERELVDKVRKYRLTQESVKLAVASGMPSGEIIALLEKHARKPLPQNVAYSISDWGGKAHLAQGYAAMVFEADSPESLRQAMTVPAFRELVWRELGDRVVCLQETLSEETIQQLRDAGLYIDWQHKNRIQG